MGSLIEEFKKSSPQQLSTTMHVPCVAFRCSFRVGYGHGIDKDEPGPRPWGGKERIIGLMLGEEGGSEMRRRFLERSQNWNRSLQGEGLQSEALLGAPMRPAKLIRSRCHKACGPR